MTLIVSGHGARIDSAETFVPDNTIVKFYSDVDWNLASVVALVAILDGASAPARETVQGAKIYNYEMRSDDDEFVEKLTALGPTAGIPVLHVGGAEIPDRTRLCSTPDKCQREGVHSCAGVLGVLAGRNETDIVILACRGREQSKRHRVEEHYGTDSSHLLYNIAQNREEFLQEFMAVARTDPEKAEQMADGFDRKDLALLTTDAEFLGWQQARALNKMAAEKDYQGMAKHFEANLGNIQFMMSCAWEVRAYRATIGEALEDSACEAELSKLPDATQKRIRKEMDRNLAHPDWEPEASELAKIATANATALGKLKDGDSAIIMVAGDVVLIGKGHREKIVDYVKFHDQHEIGRFHLVKAGAFRGATINVTGITDEKARVTQALQPLGRRITFDKSFASTKPPET